MEQEEKIFKALLKVVREGKTTIVPYPEMGNFTEEDIHVVEPSTGPYQGEILFIYEGYCVNPHCDCRSVHLRLVPKSDKSPNKPVYFSLNFDTREIDWQGQKRVPEEFKALAEEFCKDVYESFGSMFFEHYREAKEFGLKLCNLLNACSEFTEKAMVSYCDISPETRPWCFSCGKDMFTVIDHYCAQPDCLCQDVVLTFYKLPECKGHHASASDILAISDDIMNPLFAIRLREDGQFVEEEMSINHVEMKQLIKAFESKMPSIRTEVLSRLRKVKEFGRMMVRERISGRQIRRLSGELSRTPPGYYEPPQRPEPVIVKKKVGRNEPCPCGSGKKYKKCCGR